MAECMSSSQMRFKDITEKHRHTCSICKKVFEFGPRNNIIKLNTLFIQHRTLHLYRVCLNCSINNWIPEKQKYQVYVCIQYQKPLHRETLYSQCFQRGCFYIHRKYVKEKEFRTIQQLFKRNRKHCCSSPYIKHDKKSGELICANCGIVHQQKTVASSVQVGMTNPMKGNYGSVGRQTASDDPW